MITAGGKFDLIGGILFAPGIAGLLLCPTLMPRHGLISPVVLVLFTASIGTLIIWYRHERRHPSPMVDVGLLFDRQIAIGNMAYMMLGLGAFQLTIIVMMLIQQPASTGVGLGLSAVMASILKIPSSSSALAAPISGIYVQRHGARLVAIWGAAITVGAWLFLAIFHKEVWQIIVALVLCAIGTGVQMATLPNLLIERSPPAKTGEVTGVMGVCRALSSGIGAQVVMLLLAASTVVDEAKRYPSPLAYQLAIWFVIGCSVAGLLLCLALPRRLWTQGEIEPNAKPPSKGL